MGKNTQERKVKRAREHYVRLDLIVLVMNEPETERWFAQSLQVDYFAEGASVEEVKANFASGFTATVARNLEVHGNLDGFLSVQAPSRYWLQFFKLGKKPRRNAADVVELPARGNRPGLKSNIGYAMAA